MKRFRWSMYKALDFMQMRRPDLAIRANFINQLSLLEQKLIRAGNGPKSSSFNETSCESSAPDTDELVLHNTYLNSQTMFKGKPPPPTSQNRTASAARHPPPVSQASRRADGGLRGVRWSDNGTGDRHKLQTMLIPIDGGMKPRPFPHIKKNEYKSIIKGSDRVFTVRGAGPEDFDQSTEETKSGAGKEQGLAGLIDPFAPENGSMKDGALSKEKVSPRIVPTNSKPKNAAAAGRTLVVKPTRLPDSSKIPPPPPPDDLPNQEPTTGIEPPPPPESAGDSQQRTFIVVKT
jgi:hypothetical protein